MSILYGCTRFCTSFLFEDQFTYLSFRFFVANDVRDMLCDVFSVCLLLILYSFGLACCAIEMMHMATGEFKCYL